MPFRSVLAGLLLLSLAQPDTAAAQPGGGPAPVRVALASMQSLSSETLVPGTVISRSDARLAAEVEGRLIAVAEVGTSVDQGEPVATIEDQVLRLQNSELQAEIRRAEARLRFLEKEVERIASLAESKLASVTQLEQVRSDRDIARGDLEVARARLAQNADLLARTLIQAPFRGVVVERLMTPGERVIEGSAVVRLVDQEHLEVVARAPLEYFHYSQPGHLLSLRSGDVTVLGEVRKVVAVGDENTHQFELRIDLDGAPFLLGQTLRVAVATSNRRDVLTVPRDALVLRPDGISVFVVDTNNEARQVSVTTGIGSGDQIEVHGTLAPGDRVVIRGNERLQPGQSVNILDS
jgi:RND family efflux transporter MFP subunit